MGGGSEMIGRFRNYKPCTWFRCVIAKDHIKRYNTTPEDGSLCAGYLEHIHIDAWDEGDIVPMGACRQRTTDGHKTENLSDAVVSLTQSREIYSRLNGTPGHQS